MEALRPALRDALLDLVKQRETDLRTAGDKHAANNVYSLGVELGSIPTDYNGWSNYPTWAVNLWLSNDKGLYNMTLEAVNDEYEDAPNCIQVRDGIWTLEQARRSNTANRLREMIEELPHTLGEVEELNSGFTADLYGWALGQVDWDEIAAVWLGNLAELREYEETQS